MFSIKKQGKSIVISTDNRRITINRRWVQFWKGDEDYGTYTEILLDRESECDWCESKAVIAVGDTCPMAYSEYRCWKHRKS